jgi:hypothetical protein
MESFGSSTLHAVPRSPTAALVAHLARIRDLSDDLVRELNRDSGKTTTVRAMVAAIKRDVDAVYRAVNRPKR